MSDSNEIENILDSLNLTGQYQPTGVPDMSDYFLNDQILSDVVFSVEDPRLTSTSSQNDEISHALVDPTLSEFHSFQGITSDVSDSSTVDDIGKWLSLSWEDSTKQSTIEDAMENVSLNTSSSEILASVSSIPMGSSPVEHKIDSCILASPFTQSLTRSNKPSSKSRKTSHYDSSLSTVGPIDIFSSYSGCHPCTTSALQHGLCYDMEELQFDSMMSKKIQFRCQPRSRFRPRTQAESKYAAHYIRCEQNEPFEYPTIYIPISWSRESIKNIIEVTLVCKNRQPHLYMIDNKTCCSEYNENALVFREKEQNSLYFSVTKEDFDNGYKCLMVEFIKRKQDEIVTKDSIRSLQLDQSMLRVTRFYQTGMGPFQKDEASTEYSTLMVEAYGDVAIEHMGPRYGPMGGNEPVYVLLKGRVVKDDITIVAMEPSISWCQHISFTKSGNLLHFVMPAYPYSRQDEATVNIIVYYKGDELQQMPYLYKGSLDQALSQLTLQDPASNATSSTMSDGFNFFAATGALPTRPSPKRSSTAKSTKRLARK